MQFRIGVIALLTGLLCVPLAVDSASAQGRGRGQGQGQVQGQDQGQEHLFSDRDRELVLRHYTTGLPAGLDKREDLPPGLAKQLRRNGTLPPGLQKKLRPFPRTLLDQLRPLPTGYRFGIVDEHVVIYRADTFVIADIILHIVR